MAKKKLSIEDVVEIVDQEGLGYAIQHYMSADKIADPKLAKLWAEAKSTLDQIELLLMIE